MDYLLLDELGDIKGAEEVVIATLFNKLEDFFNLDKLRKAVQADVRALDQWRDVIPEYTKDYVSLNRFVA